MVVYVDDTSLIIIHDPFVSVCIMVGFIFISNETLNLE
jgi:hypothetical protein